MTDTPPMTDATLAAPGSAFPIPMTDVIVRPSRLYRMARSGLTTALALTIELLELVVFLMVADLELASMSGRLPYVDHAYTMTTLVLVFGAIQYLLVGLELFATQRAARHGITLPLVFLPFGRSARFVLMITICTLVLVPKLVFYFLTLTVALPFLEILSRIGVVAPLTLIDLIDVVLEPIERGVNWFYNLLHYGKIESRGSAFTAAFNLWLTPWCLNH